MTPSRSWVGDGMPYLSRISLNPLREATRQLLAQPQALHAAVLGGLSRQPVTERVLWRVDADEPRKPALFVLTQSRPSWEHLVEQASWPSSDEPQALTREYEPLLARVVAGREFAFRLASNPVQSRRNPQKPSSAQAERAQEGRSARLGHRTVRHQMEWLLDRTERWGFEIPPARTDLGENDGDVRDVKISGRARRSFRRRHGDPPVVIQTVVYDGRLVVRDAELFRERLLSGFGPAKAYGCGLLTLAPLAGEMPRG
jgi:CRISPR system Cascade subunit CasE